jgi:formate hydrogenlyase subunit 3/multisubunit Na+/H+ antiporter MnhD subunit
MGLSAGRAALVSVIELAVLLTIAVAAAFIAVPVVVARLTSRFDPAPERPPNVQVLVSWPPLIAAAVVGTVAICALVWWSEWIAGRRPAGEVVRDGG